MPGLKTPLYPPLIFLLLGLCTIRCTQPSAPQEDPSVSAHIDSLLQVREVFQARKLFDTHQQHLSVQDSLVFASQLDHYFNRSQASNGSINRLRQDHWTELDATRRAALLKTQLQNHVRLFAYGPAAQTITELLEEYSSHLDAGELKELRNEQNLWHGLRNEAPQTVVRKAESRIPMVGGSRIPTFFNDSEQSVDLTFDTGANLSLIIESLADSFEIEYVDARVGIQGILGNEIMARVGVASSMRFGNVALNNVVLLVFPDSTLYFKEADFQIYGIMGYPVIAALGEIQRTRDGLLRIPSEVSQPSYSNLALEYLTPLIEVIHDGDSLVFTFDTGAGETWLYEKYYRTHQDRIDRAYEKTTLSAGGVGAVQQYSAYRIDFPFRIGTAHSALPSAIVLDTTFHSEHRHYSGNLGQDVVQLFDTMTVNFESMFIAFSNE